MSGIHTVALTGGTGFLGRHIAAHLHESGYRVRLLLRSPVTDMAYADSVVIGDIARPLNMTQALEGVDAIVHSAGIAHAMSGRPDDDYRQINSQATLHLAERSAKAGVKKFIFISSIRAQSGPTAEHVLTEADPMRPTDGYGRSKSDAELALANIGISWTALRPVVIYGEGAVGNIAALIKLAATGWPLPLGSIKARRSLVSTRSVASAISHAMTNDTTAQRAFIVADNDPLTIGEMLAALREGMGLAPRIWPAPAAPLALAARLIGQDEKWQRLAGALMADSSALQATGWHPASTSHAGLVALGRAHAKGKN